MYSNICTFTYNIYIYVYIYTHLYMYDICCIHVVKKRDNVPCGVLAICQSPYDVSCTWTLDIWLKFIIYTYVCI